jgi:3-oxoacyl-[acyl-carrier-protein] synthase III
MKGVSAVKLGEGLGVRAVRAWLPPTVETAGSALAAGRLSVQDLAEGGVHALPVALDLAPPQMAVRAAREVLAVSDTDASRLGLGVHAWIHHQGHDFWSPAHYILRELGAGDCEAVGIQTMCNGGTTGLGIAAARLLADPEIELSLVTTADRFDPMSFDRWAADYGVYYGDGATATLLGRRDDMLDELTLLALATATVPMAEQLHRGRDPFSPAPRWHSDRIDVKRTKKAFLEEFGVDGFRHAAHAAINTVVSVALDDAGINRADARIRYVAVPRVGAKVRQETYVPAVRAVTGAEILDLGTDTGHLGAGDTAANLAVLVEDKLLEPGQIALVVSAGAGFSFSCALVSCPDPMGVAVDTP